ncbi:MAG: T9SS type A sorting domain-containing protein [Ignavibacteria bacterium]
MKKLKTLSKLLLLSLILIGCKNSYSQTPTYNLTVKNIHLVAPDSLTFEIYILHTNQSVTDFYYCAGQYFFRFNSGFGNGGTLKYRRLASGLPPGIYPLNPTVTGNELRLATNLPPAPEAAPMISDTLPGTLVARMSLRTSAGSFAAGQYFGLRWRNDDDPPLYTKVSCFIGTKAVEITTPLTHSVDSSMSSIEPLSDIVPQSFNVYQNYPNPFNPVTQIKFDIAKNSNAKLSVYDITGKVVEVLVNEKLIAGSYEFKWDASKYSSGIYFYRLQTDKYNKTMRMVLIK